MQFGKTLIGAVIGAALGIGMLVVVYLQFGIDKMYMAIPVALLTGLGVRMMVAGSGQASYLRGAITVVIALGAYLGGLQIATAFANKRASDLSKGAVARADTEQPADEPAATKGPEDGPAAPAAAPDAQKMPAAARQTVGEPMRPQMPKTFSTWDFLALAVAALVAYELGRGTGRTATTVPSEPLPARTHPDA